MSKSSYAFTSSPDSRGTRGSSFTYGTSCNHSFETSSTRTGLDEGYNPITNHALYFADKARRKARSRAREKAKGKTTGEARRSESHKRRHKSIMPPIESEVVAIVAAKAEEVKANRLLDSTDYSLDSDPLLLSFVLESGDPTLLSPAKSNASGHFLKCGGVELPSTKKDHMFATPTKLKAVSRVASAQYDRLHSSTSIDQR
jgi:hypothetical protein